jgi:hypothetical protein
MYRYQLTLGSADTHQIEVYLSLLALPLIHRPAKATNRTKIVTIRKHTDRDGWKSRLLAVTEETRSPTDSMHAELPSAAVYPGRHQTQAVARGPLNCPAGHREHSSA